MIINLLLLAGIPFLFVLFDFFIFLFKHPTAHSDEPLKYYPDFKIWGMGFILGLTVSTFSLFEPLIEVSLGKKIFQLDRSEIAQGQDIKILYSQVSSVELIQQIAILLFFLAFLGIIVTAAVKIVNDR